MVDNKENKRKMKNLMQVPGVKGGIKTKPYEGWLEIESFQWGMGLGIYSGRRNRRGGSDSEEEEEEQDIDTYKEREASDPSISEITINKVHGFNSTRLLFRSFDKEKFPRVLIDQVVQLETGELIPQSRFVLKEVLISGFSSSGGSGEPTSESLSFNFGSMEYSSFDEVGKEVASFSYNTESNEAVLYSGPEKNHVETVVKKNEDNDNNY
eukprot:TRINITY_DN3035_c1_g1_i2.p1 TRINITY_DN3035_c1_g1~~TRINITY_DN3035_c1_g1_i2.p1  ORF type:complete len:210 (+),score=89.11 TRINITY_DN3035_c1_g1_i2:639-1268(+)